MKQKGFTTILIIFSFILTLFVAYRFVLPAVKRMQDINGLQKILRPDIYVLIKNGILDSSSTDKIISLQKPYSYLEAGMVCDPEVYNCDTEKTPTKKQKEDKYYKLGHECAEYGFLSGDVYKKNLDKLFEEKYYYQKIIDSPDHTFKEVVFATKDMKSGLSLGIELPKTETSQYLDVVSIGIFKYFNGCIDTNS